MRGPLGRRFWQRSFYDHIIRNERDLDAVREYVTNNPIQWVLDRDNPAIFGMSEKGANLC